MELDKEALAKAREAYERRHREAIIKANGSSWDCLEAAIAAYLAAVKVTEEDVERAAKVLCEKVHLRCYDDRCTCFSGRERWECLASGSLDSIARACLSARKGG